MVFITADTWGKNGIEVTTVNGIKWFNETNIGEQLGRVNFRYTSSNIHQNLENKYKI